VRAFKTLLAETQDPATVERATQLNDQVVRAMSVAWPVLEPRWQRMYEQGVRAARVWR
jgi:hypothetical protein